MIQGKGRPAGEGPPGGTSCFRESPGPWKGHDGADHTPPDRRNASAQPQSRQARTKAFLGRLIAEYPVFAEHQPLAIGVHLPLQAAMPDTSKALIRRALAMHCSCQCYLRVVVDASDRYALDGSVCGAVTEPQREAAKERLLRAAAKERQKESPAESAPIHLSQTPAPKPTAWAYPILRLKRR